MKLLQTGAVHGIEWYKKNWKRLLFSSFITFLTGVSLILLQEIDSITIESFKDGSVLGVVFVGVRLGVKMVIEFFLTSTD